MQSANSNPKATATPGAISDKVPVGQKLAYGLGTFHDMWGHWLYPNLGFQVFNIYLGVAPWLIGVGLFINRIFDAVTDPLFGWLSDNTRSRWGRRRPYLLIAGILSGLALPFLVAVSHGWGITHLNLWLHWSLNLGFWTWKVDLRDLEISNYFWYMIVSSACFLPIMSAFKVPYDCLGAEMTPDYHERTVVWSFRNGVQKFGELGLFFAAQFMTMSIWVGATHKNAWERVHRLFTSTTGWHASAVGAKPNILLGAQVYCTILGCIMVVAAVVMFFVLRERYYGNVIARKQEKVRLRETIWLTLKCRPFRMQLMMKLPYAVGTSMVGALGYYDTIYFVCRGNNAQGAVWNFYMGIAGMVLGFLGIPVFAYVAKRLGKRRAVMYIMVCAIAVFFASWWLYTPAVPFLQLFATGFIAFTGAGFWMMDGSIRADVIDYDELETGKRREGAFTACDSWITKVGTALGAGASGIILSMIGFDAALGADQPPHAIFLIRFLFAAVPILGLCVGFAMIYFFPLTPEKMAQIRLQLEARRGAV